MRCIVTPKPFLHITHIFFTPQRFLPLPVIKASAYRIEDGTPIFAESAIGDVPAITGNFSAEPHACTVNVPAHETGAPAGTVTLRFQCNVALAAGDQYTVCFSGFTCQSAKLVGPIPAQISPEAAWSDFNSYLVLKVIADIAINQSLTVFVDGLHMPVSSKVLPYPSVTLTAVEGRKRQAVTPTYQLSNPESVFARGAIKNLSFSVLKKYAGEFCGTAKVSLMLTCGLTPGDVLRFSLPGYHGSDGHGEATTAPVKQLVPAHFCSNGVWDPDREYAISFRVNREVKAMHKIHLEFTEIRNPIESQFLPLEKISVVALKSNGERFSEVAEVTCSTPIVGKFVSTELTIEDAVAGQTAGPMTFDIQV